METVTTEERPFDYIEIYQRLLAKAGKASISDKDAGKMLKVPQRVKGQLVRKAISERQIRVARMEGMDAKQADLFCVGLGTHVTDVFGYDAWVTPEVLADADAEDANDPYFQKV